MKRMIISLIIGLVLGGGVTLMAVEDNIAKGDMFVRSYNADKSLGFNELLAQTYYLRDIAESLRIIAQRTGTSR